MSIIIWLPTKHHIPYNYFIIWGKYSNLPLFFSTFFSQQAHGPQCLPYHLNVSFFLILSRTSSFVIILSIHLIFNILLYQDISKSPLCHFNRPAFFIILVLFIFILIPLLTPSRSKHLLILFFYCFQEER